MSRTTARHLNSAVRRLNFALGIVEKSKGEYIVARVPRGWQLWRDYHSGPVTITSGSRSAGEVYRHIEAMLDGIAAARGQPVPRFPYSKYIKRDQQRVAAAYCASCDTVHPAPSDCCPVTGEEYGTGGA
jgi:hypothetical protein